MFGKKQNRNMKDLKLIVKENLRKKYLMNEELQNISLLETEDQKLVMTMNYFGNLIDEGYTERDIKEVIEEQFGWLSSLLGLGGPTKVTSGDVATKDTAIKTGEKGAMSQFRGYLIKKVLGWMGFKGPLADAVATAFADMNIMELISVFRTNEGCMQNGKTVVLAISEGMVRFILEETIESDSMASNFITNTLFEYIRGTDFSNQATVFFCNVVHHTKNQVASQIKGQTQTQTAQVNTPNQS